VRGGTEGAGRGIGVWRGADGTAGDTRGTGSGLAVATTCAMPRTASGGAVAVSVAGKEGEGAAKGDDVAMGDGDTTGDEGDEGWSLRALGGGGGMLRGGGSPPSWVEAAGSTGPTLRRGGGGGADGLGCGRSPSVGAVGRGIEIGPVLLLGLGGAATGRGGTAELPEPPRFDPSFSDMKPLAQSELLVPKIVERAVGTISRRG